MLGHQNCRLMNAVVLCTPDDRIIERSAPTLTLAIYGIWDKQSILGTLAGTLLAWQTMFSMAKEVAPIMQCLGMMVLSSLGLEGEWN